MEKLERKLSDIIDEADSWEFISCGDDEGENVLTTNKDLLIVLLMDFITKNYIENGK